MKYSSLFKFPKSTKSIPKGNYIVQRKMDGERMLFVDRGNTGFFINRRGNIKNKQFPEFNQLARKLPGKNIVDGEMVVFNKKGFDSFKMLAERSHLKYGIKEKLKTNPATFMAFDVLNFQNRNVQQMPLSERSKMLNSFPSTSRFKKVKSYPKSKAKDFLRNKNVEGVVFKKPSSVYNNKKDDSWLKLKQRREADVVVRGYKEGRGERKGTVGSVYLGVWDGEKVEPIGKAGSFDGFKRDDLKQWKARFDKIKTKKVDDDVYVKPKYYAKVIYLKKGSQGKLREPRVLGFRTDLTLKDTHASYTARGQYVLSLARKIKNRLRPYSYKIEIVGSIRRKKEPNDIDIVLIPKNRNVIRKKLLGMGKIKAEGESLIFARIGGVDVDIFFSDLKSFGAQLLTRTGPKGGNIGNRTLAKHKGLLLNQYGLFKGNKRIAGSTEKGIYEALGKQYKKPELRGV